MSSENKIKEASKTKAATDNKLNQVPTQRFLFERVENIVGKMG